MSMNRRKFLFGLAGAAASAMALDVPKTVEAVFAAAEEQGIDLDKDRLLWEPGKKSIFIPEPKKIITLDEAQRPVSLFLDKDVNHYAQHHAADIYEKVHQRSLSRLRQDGLRHVVVESGNPGRGDWMRLSVESGRIQGGEGIVNGKRLTAEDLGKMDNAWRARGNPHRRPDEAVKLDRPWENHFPDEE